MNTLNFIEVNYHYHTEFRDPSQAIQLHRASNLFAAELKDQARITLVKHLDADGYLDYEGISYAFFRSKKGFMHVPFRTHRFIVKQAPDVVLVQGFIFPIQVMALRLRLGQKCLILLQHHGEKPFGRKRILQKIADRCVNAYLFTSLRNGIEWRTTRIIRDDKKCFELPSSSTIFQQLDKERCRQQTGMLGNLNFLWVGRLDNNKDPLTVVAAFARFAVDNPTARLYMIYQRDDLLPSIVSLQEGNPVLADRLILIGKKPNAELEIWYNAADYFISGSHHEGGSYALTEAMACGCIPIVTNIPAAMKVIVNGKAGYFYEPGNEEALYKVLHNLRLSGQPSVAEIVRKTFEAELSPAAIAKKLIAICRQLQLV